MYDVSAAFRVKDREETLPDVVSLSMISPLPNLIAIPKGPVAVNKLSGCVLVAQEVLL